MLSRNSSDTAKPRRTLCFLDMTLMMRQEWAVELTCQGTASRNSKLSPTGKESMSFSFSAIGSNWVELSGDLYLFTYKSQLISSLFSFSLYFTSLLASYKLGRIFVIEHYLVCSKHDFSPFLSFSHFIIAGDPLERPISGQLEDPEL